MIPVVVDPADTLDPSVTVAGIWDLAALDLFDIWDHSVEDLVDISDPVGFSVLALNLVSANLAGISDRFSVDRFPSSLSESVCPDIEDRCSFSDRCPWSLSGFGYLGIWDLYVSLDHCPKSSWNADPETGSVDPVFLGLLGTNPSVSVGLYTWDLDIAVAAAAVDDRRCSCIRDSWSADPRTVDPRSYPVPVGHAASCSDPTLTLTSDQLPIPVSVSLTLVNLT